VKEPQMIFKLLRSPQIIGPYQDKYGVTYGFLRQGFECRPYVNFDAQHVAVLDYANYEYTKDLSIQYNIVAIGEYALEQILLFEKTKEKIYFEQFINQIEWLMKNRQSRPEGTYWQMEYDYADVKSPWVSGMVNGLALSCLTKAYIYTEENFYLELATSAMEFFHVLVADGGFSARVEDDQLLFQEYTNCAEWRRFALNGFLVSILGLLDYRRLVENDRVNRLIEDSVKFLKNNIYRWEHKGIWTSLYPVENGLSRSIDYHVFHTELMFCLSVMLNDEDLYQIYKRWGGLEPSITHELIEQLVRRSDVNLQNSVLGYLFEATGLPELQPGEISTRKNRVMPRHDFFAYILSFLNRYRLSK
jgi:hypothetical protein